MLRHLRAGAARTLDRAVRPMLTADDLRDLGEDGSTHAARVRILTAARDSYASAHAAGDGRLFAPVGELEPTELAREAFQGGVSIDLAWRSRFAVWADRIRERYLRHRGNATAATRLLVHDGAPRPAVVAIHGYRGGFFRWTERLWDVWRWFDLGFDVALVMLPFHAARREPDHRGPPPFPSGDPWIAVEAFRQSVIDIGDILEILRRRGTSDAFLLGRSLGAYIAALTATVQPNLAGMALMVPFASLADMAHTHGRLTGDAAEQETQRALMEEAYAPVSPIARPSRIEPARVQIFAAEWDGITPPSHARRLAAHFGTDVQTFEGGHLLQFGRSKAFDQIARRMFAMGLTAIEPGTQPSPRRR